VLVLERGFVPEGSAAIVDAGGLPIDRVRERLHLAVGESTLAKDGDLGRATERELRGVNGDRVLTLMKQRRDVDHDAAQPAVSHQRRRAGAAAVDEHLDEIVADELQPRLLGRLGES
jgi:hypothetical protein